MHLTPFCTRCGLRFAAGDQFCADCGAGRYLRSCSNSLVAAPVPASSGEEPVPDPIPDPLAGFSPVEWSPSGSVLSDGVGILAARIGSPQDAHAALAELRAWGIGQERLARAVANLITQIEQQLPLIDRQEDA